MSNLTDWEIGNDMLHKLVDECFDLHKQVKDTHDDLADVLYLVGNILGVACNGLQSDTPIAPQSENIKADALRLTATVQCKRWWARRKPISNTDE